jgi:hypothetical protein
MKSVKWAVFYGFLIWLIVFAVAMLIYPLRSSNRSLFESLMPVSLVTCVTAFAVLYFQRVESRPLREGILLGVVWFIVNLAIDQLMFSWGPMKMSFADYMADIGLTYLLIPVIPIGIGYLLAKRA